MADQKLIRTIVRILKLLVSKEYKELEKLAQAKRMASLEIRDAIRDYDDISETFAVLV